MLSWRRTGRGGTAIPRPSAPPSGWLSSRRWARHVVMRRAQPAGVPFAHVGSAVRSVGGVEALRGPQRPCWRASIPQRWVRKGLRLARYVATREVLRGW
jgi:hypothetical protein